MYEVISLLAFSLGWFSLGVAVYIAHNQGKIREELEQEKIKRRHRAILRLADSIFTIELDLEWYRNKFDTTYQSITEEELDGLKETIQLYYPDLSVKEIQEAEGIMFQTKYWLDHPVYEKDLTVTAQVTQVTTYESILKQIEQLDKLLTDTIDNLDKSIIKTY